MVRAKQERAAARSTRAPMLTSSTVPQGYRNARRRERAGRPSELLVVWSRGLRMVYLSPDAKPQAWRCGTLGRDQLDGVCVVSWGCYGSWASRSPG
jgi:hypothetical protein